ncbi:methylated-DNA-[protein]-cysteine S-methyltransferase family protein [Yersinia frederiksenii]|nr:methylated-DNA-[protein]-cysteine S-methyltransferase family protein [Yersinia frederiksenii]
MVSYPVVFNYQLNLFSSGTEITDDVIRSYNSMQIADNKEDAVTSSKMGQQSQDETEARDDIAEQNSPPVVDSFRQRVFHVVAAIPYGQVTTYGDIARLIGSPRAARQVGGVLKRLPEGSTLPWYRVINRHGEISLVGEDYLRQKNALLAEGIDITPAGRIDLQKYRWQYQ